MAPQRQSNSTAIKDLDNRQEGYKFILKMEDLRKNWVTTQAEETGAENHP